ncbi:unnamed protein product [Leuciscus chuanchicus]
MSNEIKINLVLRLDFPTSVKARAPATSTWAHWEISDLQTERSLSGSLLVGVEGFKLSPADAEPNRAASGSGSECHLLRQVPELFHQNIQRRHVVAATGYLASLLTGLLLMAPSPLDPGEWASDADDHY